MGQKVEFPVFTETNLGTRIVIAVSPDITAGKFKGINLSLHNMLKFSTLLYVAFSYIKLFDFFFVGTL